MLRLWQQQRRQLGRGTKVGGGNLTLDISTCATGYCAVEVVGNSTCGRTVLRFATKKMENTEQEATGRLELTPGAEHFTVRLVLTGHRDTPSTKLSIAGHSGDNLALYRRTYDYQNVFARAGDAVCKPPIA